MNRWLRSSWLVLGLCAAGFAGCAGRGPDLGGLMLVVRSEGESRVDRLEIAVSKDDRPLYSRELDVPDETELPTTLGIASNGDRTTTVTITVVGWAGDEPIDRRDAIVTQIPTDRVAMLSIVLSDRCASHVMVVGDQVVSDCGEGQTCQPSTGLCTSATTDGATLPSYETGDEDAAAADFTSPAGEAVCGNGQLEGAELCDDGNEQAGDGCSVDCLNEESGFACLRPGERCLAVPVCGDGTRQRGEGCDDGQVSPSAGDGCDERCQLEPDHACPTPGESCSALDCGDGVVMPPETCDDGGAQSGDGCSSACQLEPGFHCTLAGCEPACGDGLQRGTEGCDDGNAQGGDGCSSSCQIEIHYECSDGDPSSCSSSISCGNGTVEPGEVCDPPNSAGCGGDCQAFTAVLGETVCGNQAVESGEACDPPGPGCSAGCQLEAGWACYGAGSSSYCVKVPVCGDSTLDSQLGEECDPPQPGAGCSATCQRESGWLCAGSPSICDRAMCGDSSVQAGEQCDDGDQQGGDGCSAGCQREAGYTCGMPGQACQPRCGDGIKAGSEQCDDGNTENADGCNTACRLEAGYVCPAPNAACEPVECGDGDTEGVEGCDDGNSYDGDGCSHGCAWEPTVQVGTNPVVQGSCGDAFTAGVEECDDGNRRDGDGCDQDCLIENGWNCANSLELTPTLPATLKYRDFRSGNAMVGTGHPDFQYAALSHVAGIAGAACTSANQATCGRLDAQGKPQLVLDNQATTGIMNDDTFGLWFRDSNPGNVKNHLGNNIAMMAPFVSLLSLSQTGGGASEVFTFSSNGNNFYPLNSQGFGAIGSEVGLCGGNTGVPTVSGNPACSTCDATCQNRNFGFTSELRFVFQYKGGEVLTFQGDDDVWVFVNGRLGVDMGGVHPSRYGQVVLGDDGNGGAGDSDCSAHAAVSTPPDPNGACYTAAERSNATDGRFGLTKGGLYELVFFHAERITGASNFRLTLGGFQAPRSVCDAECGDGIRTGSEACDDGVANSNTAANGCHTDCSARSSCGDGVKKGAETCDNGLNTDLYSSSAGACAPGCVAPGRCGDGMLQLDQGEECDNGAANDNGAYGPSSCTTQCKLGGRCGDGTPQAGEACDAGPNNGTGYGPSACSYDCKAGPRCGDHIVNGGEGCDEGGQNGSETSACSATCELEPFCGDGVEQGNEACDYAQFASDRYGGCTDQCMLGPRCGDGGGPDAEEECDSGDADNTGAYGGCTDQCMLAARCGDGVVQSGEACDNGFNRDDYDYPGTGVVECGPDCTLPPHCGDGLLEPAWEACDEGADNDDDAYLGCATDCSFGPFCGDGSVDMADGETCDDGAQNVLYAPEAGACALDCRPAPYCGDGIRNGPEACDLGPAGGSRCSPSCQAL